MKMFMSFKILNPGQYLSQLLVDVCNIGCYFAFSTAGTVTTGTSSTNTNRLEFSGLYQVKIVSAFLNLIFSTILTTCSYSRPYRLSATCLWFTIQTAFAPFRPLICITALTSLRCLLFQLIAASRTS